jgi:PKHD-type hydroxylase
LLVQLASVLSQSDLEAVRQVLMAAPFVDGKLSAGEVARQVKNNEEVDLQAGEVQQLNNLVMGKLVQHPVYRAAALPMKVAAPFYARYTEGMEYGDHVDDPIMHADKPYRSDISITIFLNDASDYEGGELAVRTSFGVNEIKLNAGDAIMYPSSSVHHVNRVTSGVRVVAVTWLQSLVRDPAQREILYDLYQVREKMLAEKPTDEQTKQVDRSYVNLVRMWSDV